MKALFFLFTVLVSSYAIGQSGLSVSPSRLYYTQGAGASAKQIIYVTNPGEQPLEIGVSISDWKYDQSGYNIIGEANIFENSCSDWVQIFPSTYFIIPPRETKEVEVLFNVPPGSTNLPVHTAMVFFTQLNPGKAEDLQGTAIQVAVKTGVKVYHSFYSQSAPILEILDFKSYSDERNNKIAELLIENRGRIWADGKVKWELFNSKDGKKTNLSESQFYTLPGNTRFLRIELPKDLQSSTYLLSAIMTFGDKGNIKVSELEFKL